MHAPSVARDDGRVRRHGPCDDGWRMSRRAPLAALALAVTSNQGNQGNQTDQRGESFPLCVEEQGIGRTGRGGNTGDEHTPCYSTPRGSTEAASGC